jgi:nanoRNase/pAp phosphatase (c-di-AMP/oligoRNAs hydrolase)
MPDTFKQVAEKLNASSGILIVLSQVPTPDVVAAGLGLAGYLKRLEKDVVVVSSDGNLNPRVSFLAGYDEVLREISIAKGFVIDVSTARTQIAELSYKKEGDKLSVYLKPKAGQFEPSDVSFRTSRYPYDAIVTIGAAALADLGAFYGKHAEMFFETPVINIDFRGANQNFAQFNLVHLTATSDSEIVYDLITEMERELVDKGIATLLLAGIIAETNSFQHSRTTPQAFLKASQLVGIGADQQDIVNKLFKSKNMGFLKLWGRVLERLKHEPESHLAHSSVSAADVLESGASAEDVSAVLKEMSLQLAFAKVHVFFQEAGQGATRVHVAAPASLNLSSAFAEYSPDSSAYGFRFLVPAPAAEAERLVLERVRSEAKKLS